MAPVADDDEALSLTVCASVERPVEIALCAADSEVEALS